MALNKFMHPRNPFFLKKPNFKALAAKYEQFKEHCDVDDKGNVHLDLKKPESLRALSWVLVKEEFDLDVEMPLDRLIPAIPQRLNYILWLEDVLGVTHHGHSRGIDIGTGASCIYPLLGAKKNKWRFLASEMDPTSFSYAQNNVTKNGLQDLITVVQTSDPAGMLCDLLEQNEGSFDFCMCNPPFFASLSEAWGILNSRRADRPEPFSVSTASPQESVSPGGEVQFVKQIIADSLVLKDRIKVYSSMLGKKASLAVLKAELRNCGVTNIGTTELCQGRTMRWVLAWTFVDGVKFPPSLRKRLGDRPPAPLVWKIPKCRPSEVKHSVTGLTVKLKELFAELQMRIDTCEESSSSENKWLITAFQNTWIHQRRQRREQQRAMQSQSSGNVPSKQDFTPGDPETSSSRASKRVADEQGQNDSKRVRVVDSISSPSEPQVRSTDTELGTVTPDDSKDCAPSPSTSPNMGKDSAVSDPDVSLNDSGYNPGESADEAPLLQANVCVKEDETDVIVELSLADAGDKNLLHQVLQYLKNKIK